MLTFINMYNFKEIIFTLKTAALLSVICTGCSYKIGESDTGDPLLGKKMSYKFMGQPDFETFTKIDTAAFYIQIFEGRYYNDTEKQNPDLLIFHTDGFFEKALAREYDKTKQMNRNSLYGGRYQVNGNILQIEHFVPSRGGNTKYWKRLILKAQIADDKLIFRETNHSSLAVYKKLYKLP